MDDPAHQSPGWHLWQVFATPKPPPSGLWQDVMTWQAVILGFHAESFVARTNKGRDLQRGTRLESKSMLLEQTLPKTRYQRRTRPRIHLKEAFWLPTPKTPLSEREKSGPGMSKKLWRHTIPPLSVHQKQTRPLIPITTGEDKTPLNGHTLMQTSLLM